MTTNPNRPRGVLYDADPDVTFETLGRDYRVPTVQELREFKGPAASESLGNRWNPIHHCDWIEAIRYHADRSGWEIESEAYALSKDRHAMHALFHFNAWTGDGADRVYKALCAITDNLQRTRARFLSGGYVFVCHNGVVEGQELVGHKQTTNLDPDDLARKAFAKWEAGQARLNRMVEIMKSTGCDDSRLTYYLGRAVGLDGSDPIMSAAMARRVRAEYLSPRHEVFQPRTTWSLYNAATETMKHEARMSNSTAARLQMELGHILVPADIRRN